MRFFLILMGFLFCTQLPAQNLGELSFDRWTKNLADNSNGQSLNWTQLQQDLTKAVHQFQSSEQLFNQVLSTTQKYKISSWEESFALAEHILRLRQTVRLDKNIEALLKRKALFVLQMMAEEVIYTAQKMFQPKETELVINGIYAALPRSALLRQFRVQTGDILLSKATGSGSSSFIALSMQNPHIYSHSAPVYIDNQNRLFSPEAFIEDGVKLRNLKTDYIEGSKTRLAIYRYRGSDIAQRMALWKSIESAMENFVTEMKTKVADIEKETSFPYDFKMDPSRAEKSYFCSGVAYQLYSEPGIATAANPYNKEVWSQWTGARRSLVNTLGIDSEKVPAPGDMENNPLFELVGFRLDLNALQQERIEMAIVDDLLLALDARQESMVKIQQLLQNMGNNPLQKEDILKFIESGLLPASMQQMAQDNAAEIPSGVNLKQLIFFAGLNQWIVPDLRAAVTAQMNEAESRGEIWGPVELRQRIMAQVNAALEQAAAKLEAQISALPQ